jgi:hypothetical protein
LKVREVEDGEPTIVGFDVRGESFDLGFEEAGPIPTVIVAVQQKFGSRDTHGLSDPLVRVGTMSAQDRVGERKDAGRKHRRVMSEEHIEPFVRAFDQRVDIVIGDRLS